MSESIKVEVSKADRILADRIFDALPNTTKSSLNFHRVSQAIAAWNTNSVDAAVGVLENYDDRIASLMANIRQGQSSTPRCESPSEYDIKLQKSNLRLVVSALLALKNARGTI